MEKSKTHFEQIPLKVVRRIAQEDAVDHNSGVIKVVTNKKIAPAVSLRSGKKERVSKNATH